VAPAAPGPVYLVRNVAWRFGNTRTSQQDGYLASALKINSGYSTPIGPLYLYHNTFLTDAPATDAIALLNPGSSTFIRARNNVVAGTHYSIYKVNPVSWDGDGDDLYTTDPTRLVYWQGTRYDTLPAYQAALGQEPQGLQAPPQLVAPASGNFTPQAGSPLVDAGIALPGINDGYSGGAPDVGAVEFTGPPPALSFYTLTPCRLLDTRTPADGPALAAGEVRSIKVADACGVSGGARAVSVNLAVTQPTAAGNLRLFAAGSLVPLVSTINYAAGQTRANNAVAPLSATGWLSIRCAQATGGVHVILDVNGYFE
jgi:hypothetical protein